jgi:hypothetical protein
MIPCQVLQGRKGKGITIKNSDMKIIKASLFILIGIILFCQLMIVLTKDMVIYVETILRFVVPLILLILISVRKPIFWAGAIAFFIIGLIALLYRPGYYSSFPAMQITEPVFYYVCKGHTGTTLAYITLKLPLFLYCILLPLFFTRSVLMYYNIRSPKLSGGTF